MDEANFIDVPLGWNTPAAVFRPAQFVMHRWNVHTHIHCGKNTCVLKLMLAIDRDYCV